jgi:dTMP kinase
MKPFSDGIFISVDGPSGVGKSATVQALTQLLRAEGRAVHVTGEPSDGPIGRLAYDLTDTVHGAALACLYAADRCQPARHQPDTRAASGCPNKVW